jgi:hypothetical protein
MALLQQALAQQQPQQQQNQPSGWPPGLAGVVPANQAAPHQIHLSQENMLTLLLQSLQQQQQAQPVQQAPPPQPIPELPVAQQVPQPPPVDANQALLQHLFAGNRDSLANQLHLLLQPNNRDPGPPLASPQQPPPLPLPVHNRPVDLSGPVAALQLGATPPGSARPADVAGPSR